MVLIYSKNFGFHVRNAAAFAASMAYIALNNSDLVNIFVADGGAVDKCTGLSSKQSFPKAVAFLERENKGSRTELNGSVKTLAGERLGERAFPLSCRTFSPRTAMTPL